MFLHLRVRRIALRQDVSLCRTIYHDVVRAPITAPAAGVYMVKIGNAKARKVVILR